MKNKRFMKQAQMTTGVVESRERRVKRKNEKGTTEKESGGGGMGGVFGSVASDGGAASSGGGPRRATTWSTIASLLSHTPAPPTISRRSRRSAAPSAAAAPGASTTQMTKVPVHDVYVKCSCSVSELQQNIDSVAYTAAPVLAGSDATVGPMGDAEFRFYSNKGVLEVMHVPPASAAAASSPSTKEGYRATLSQILAVSSVPVALPSVPASGAAAVRTSRRAASAGVQTVKVAVCIDLRAGLTPIKPGKASAWVPEVESNGFLQSRLLTTTRFVLVMESVHAAQLCSLIQRAEQVKAADVAAAAAAASSVGGAAAAVPGTTAASVVQTTNLLLSSSPAQLAFASRDALLQSTRIATNAVLSWATKDSTSLASLWTFVADEMENYAQYRRGGRVLRRRCGHCLNEVFMVSQRGENHGRWLLMPDLSLHRSRTDKEAALAHAELHDTCDSTCESRAAAVASSGGAGAPAAEPTQRELLDHLRFQKETGISRADDRSREVMNTTFARREEEGREHRCDEHGVYKPTVHTCPQCRTECVVRVQRIVDDIFLRTTRKSYKDFPEEVTMRARCGEIRLKIPRALGFAKLIAIDKEVMAFERDLDARVDAREANESTDSSGDEFTSGDLTDGDDTGSSD